MGIAGRQARKGSVKLEKDWRNHSKETIRNTYSMFLMYGKPYVAFEPTYSQYVKNV